MKYISKAIPGVALGIKTTGKSLVVPNQALSLQEILARFTRGEPLAIGREGQYHESEDDLEKISRMDPVDQEEFRQKWSETQQLYEQQENTRKENRRKKYEKAEREKIAQELRQKDPSAGKAADAK